MMTVTSEGRVMVVCDCCKEELSAKDSIPEVWRQAVEQGWVKTAAGKEYCAPCAKGMREK
jgi:hypothetical protein